MRSLFDIRRCRYCSPLVVISNMRCVDCREGDETTRAEVGRVGTGSASLPVTLAGCSTSKQIWDKLAKLHQMDDRNYKADIQERITTLRMSEGDDPVKFLKLFSTLLLKAQTANFKLSEEDKATYFLRALPVTYESLKSEWKSLQRIKEITQQPTSTFEDLR